MSLRAVLLAATLLLAPLAARAADLVVWWEKGFYPAEDQAVQDVIGAFEDKTGKTVELTFYPLNDLPARTVAAVEAGHPPDFVFGLIVDDYYGQWAYEGRLLELTDAMGPLGTLFDKDALDHATLHNARAGRRGLYGLPMGFSTNHLHVWRSLLAQAGFKLEDIPKDWEPFWAFWCDKVQPAVRRALGREDIWGVGLVMSVGTGDMESQFREFVEAYDANYVTRDGRLVIDDPLIRNRLIKVLDSYAAIYRKGCTPPSSVDWDDSGNNKAFLAQIVVMTPNPSLSLPSALQTTRPEDYYRNTATIEWPNGAYGQPLAIYTGFNEAAVFQGSGHEALAKELVRFLVSEAWLVHWLDFARDRLLPPMPTVLEQPFWLNLGDPHRLRSAVQFLTRPRAHHYTAVSGDWRHRLVAAENVWGRAVHRVATGAATPEQAVDEAIARIERILSEPEAK